MKNIAFFVKHFTERGTEVATYDYAKYNETILNNRSIIVYLTLQKQISHNIPTMRYSYDKFKSSFKMVEINDIAEMKNIIKEYSLDYFYAIVYGNNEEHFYHFTDKNIWQNCKTIKHCVFDTTHPEADYHISISHALNKKYGTNIPVIPHMVSMPVIDGHFRKELNIDDKAIVFGRYGGFDQFNIDYVYQAIVSFINMDNNVYFLFMNTQPFYIHPRIIYIERNVDLYFKSKFINTCDAMIHARSMGETFGLSVAEFSIKNKPVITCNCGDIEHLLILKDKALVYSSYDSLMDIFFSIREILKNKKDWNAYDDYTPEKIMKLFKKIIM